MKKKLRLTSLVMLIVAVVFVFLAIACMDVPIDVPLRLMRAIYKIYPIVMVGLFIASFFVRDEQESGKE